MLAFAAAVGLGQDAPQPKLVNLNVIAVDGRGQPVDDLTADDFQITDAGKPQKIVFFRHKDSKLSEVPAPAPNQVSNRRGAKFSYATVVLFDLLNENLGTRATVRNELERYLKSVESADDLYLYVLTVEGRLHPVHGLPEGSDDISKPGAPPWTSQIQSMMERVMNEVTRARPLAIDVALRVQLTYAALNTLGFQLARVPGHKNIVWITDGIPIELGPRRSDTGHIVDFTEEIRKLSEGLERAGVSVYPVQQFAQESSNQAAGSAAPGNNIVSNATLDEFAGSTGGRLNGGIGIGGAIRQAMNDVRTGYQIAYYPSAPAWDGKYHKLHVTSSRKGVRIQARTGYYAWAQLPDAETKHAMESLVSAPFDAAEIGLIAATSHDAANSAVTRLQVRIDAKDIALAREGEHFKGELRVAAVERFMDGHSKSSPIVAIDLQYTTQEHEQVLKDGILFGQNMTLAGNTTSVRFIIFDPGSNTLGSVTVPINGR